jgi:signal peptidase II
MRNKSKTLIFVIIILLIAADQLSKHLLIKYFHNDGAEIILLPFVSIVYLWNRGVSFGMFAKLEYSNYIFMAFAIIITSVLSYLLLRTKKKLEIVSYCLIISGAVGNIIDRILYGAVFDFIYFHVGEFHWPAFNIADSVISIGVMFLIINFIYYEKQGELK